MRRSLLTAGILAAVLASAVAVRALYLREASREPTFAHPEVDALYHDYWSRGLATGDWSPPPDCESPRIASTPYLRPPGYPYFLAGVRWAFGTGYLAPRAAQALLGLISLLVGFALVRRRFGPGPALAYAGLHAGCWTFVYFEGELLEPALLVLLGLLLLSALDRWSDGLTRRRSAAAGALLGLMVLVRPTAGLFGVLVPFWATRFRRARVGLGPLAASLVFAAAAAAVVLPATARNFVVSGTFVPVSANGSLNLLLGNHEGADGTAAAALPGLGPFRTCFDYPSLVRNLERAAGRALDGGEVAAEFRRRALSFIGGHPREFARLCVRRALLFWGPFEVGHNRQDEIVRRNSPVLRALPVSFPVAAASFALGLLAFAADRGRARGDAGPGEARAAQGALLSLAALFVLATFLAHLPFFVAGRYRVPAVPALLIPGAYGLWSVWEGLAHGRVGAAAARSALWGLLLLAFTRNPSGYRPDAGKWLFERARALAAAGDASGARLAYEEIIRGFPGLAAASHDNLGVLLMDGGDLEGAERHLRAAAALETADPLGPYNLGLVLARRGDYAAARAAFAESVARDPGFAPAHFELGRELEREGDALGAAREHAAAARLNRDAPALLRLATGLSLLGEREQAERLIREARDIERTLAGAGALRGSR